MRERNHADGDHRATAEVDVARVAAAATVGNDHLIEHRTVRALVEVDTPPEHRRRSVDARKYDRLGAGAARIEDGVVPLPHAKAAILGEPKLGAGLDRHHRNRVERVRLTKLDVALDHVRNVVGRPRGRRVDDIAVHPDSFVSERPAGVVAGERIVRAEAADEVRENAKPRESRVLDHVAGASAVAVRPISKRHAVAVAIDDRRIDESWCSGNSGVGFDCDRGSRRGRTLCRVRACGV